MTGSNDDERLAPDGAPDDPTGAIPPVDVGARSTPTDAERRGTMKRLIAVLASVAALSGIVVYLLSATSEDAFVYSKLVHDVMRNRSQFVAKEIRVEGELTPGSILFRQDPCEWRFSIQKHGEQMPVRFPQCIVPDTFRDGMGISVTVQGRLGADGTFVANQVVPRCPSKYEMQQRKNRGEATPHGPTVPGARVGGEIPTASR
ncbi:MAG: cytochrome c maturation protein CcmE [Deltaproteobacteria bacterium]|nr:cytochrome c maturation protein CcmE [Deltaproteobacteria bacterium]